MNLDNFTLNEGEQVALKDASPEYLLRDNDGYRAARIRASAQKRSNVAAFADWYGNVLEGRISAGRVRDVLSGERRITEALTRADLPLYFGDTLQRLLLADFAIRPRQWEQYVLVDDTIPDFRDVKRKALDGVDAPLDVVAAQTEYGEAQVTEAETTYRVFKRGRIVPVEWEALINDDLGGLKRMPARLSRAVLRTETKFVAELLADSTGPHGSFYTAGNNNIVTSNPTLSIAGLQTAMNVMDAQTDPGGEPISIGSVILVIPPALKVIGMNLASMIALRLTGTAVGASTDQEVLTTNWITGNLKIAVNEYLPVVSTTNGDTSWYLFADPNEGRAAIEVGFLRGFRAPQLLMKAANQVSLGGGDLDPLQGDFETDTARWKVRHILGGVQLEPRATVASDGTGS